MRIAFVTGDFPLLSETFVVNAAKAVLDAGHELTILALDPGDERAGQVQETVRSYGLERLTRRAKVPPGPLKLPVAGASLVSEAVKRGSKALGFLTHTPPEGPRIAAQNLFDVAALPDDPNFDVVHCHFGTLAPRILNLRRRGYLSGAVLVHFRGYDITSFVRKRGEAYYKPTFAEADWFVANCDHFRKRAIELGAPSDRIGILPSGLDVEGFPLSQAKRSVNDPLRLLSVGRLVGKKGFGDVITALGQLPGEMPDWHYTLIGEGPLRGELEAQAAKLELGHRITFAGALPIDEVARELGRSHLFLGPSVTAESGDQDASTNVLKEAMATGVPVVGTYHGGIPELVEPGVSGYLVNERDAAGIASAIYDVAKQPERGLALGRAGRAKVIENYSLEATGRTMLSIYEEMTGSSDHDRPT